MRLFIRLLVLAIFVGSISCQHRVTSKPAQSDTKLDVPEQFNSTEITFSNLNGWEWIARKLASDGIPKSEVERLFLDERVPKFEEVTFSVVPKDNPAPYLGFLVPSKIRMARRYLAEHSNAFDVAERRYQVSRFVIAAIFLIETQMGTAPGKHRLFYRLARLASIAEPSNVNANFERLRKEDAALAFSAVQERGEYLNQLFYPELLALFDVARLQGVDVLELKGSTAGAFGIPQFLPSSYLRYAVDANNNGTTSLFEHEDAIFSAGNFLTSHGWKDTAKESDQAAVIWNYNKSEPYVRTVLQIARILRRVSTQSIEMARG